MILRDSIEHSIADWPSIMDVLRKSGFAVFRGEPSAESALTVARKLGSVCRHRDGDEHGVTRVTAVDRSAATPGMRGLSSGSLSLHTDSAGSSTPPVYGVLVCIVPADEGGETILVDGREVFEDLARTHPAALRALIGGESLCFRSGSEHRFGNIFERFDEERLRMRWRFDEHLYVSPDTADYIDVFRHTCEAHMTTVSLPAGAGYIWDNTRWLHGRTHYRGSREFARVLLGSVQHVALPVGFRPSPAALEVVEVARRR